MEEVLSVVVIPEVLIVLSFPLYLLPAVVSCRGVRSLFGVTLLILLLDKLEVYGHVLAFSKVLLVRSLSVTLLILVLLLKLLDFIFVGLDVGNGGFCVFFEPEELD